MIIACQNANPDPYRHWSTVSRTPKQIKQRYLTEILGNRKYYRLRRSLQISQTPFHVEGINISQDKVSLTQTLDYKRTKLTDRRETNRNQKKISINTEDRCHFGFETPTNKMHTHDLNLSVRTGRQVQYNVYNVAFDGNKTQSTSLEHSSRVCNQKLKLKALENRFANQYYTIEVSHHKHQPIYMNNNDISIVKYQNVQIGQNKQRIRDLWD